MADIVSIEIIPDSAILYLGTSQQYQALATYDDGSIVDITEIAVWSVSGSPAIGSFSLVTNGLFTTSGVGLGTVYVDYGSPLYSVAIEVHNPLIVAQEADKYIYDPDEQTYLDLITSQYQNSPKYLHWIRTYLEMAMDIRRLANSLICYFTPNRIIPPDTVGYVNNAWTVREDTDFTFFDFEACVGDQLDMIGVILGQSRNVYFKAEPLSSPPTDAVNVVLTDDTYRTLLKNKVFLNCWDGKAQSLQAKWEELFPGGIITVADNQDMTIDILMAGTMDGTIINLIKNDYIIPRPQGVQVNYYYGTMPFFGFDRIDGYVAGFDTGEWA